MKLLMLILFFPFSFEGENGRELLDTALEKCSRLESLEACRDILYRYGVADRLPLSCPLKDKFRISSPYGGRIHPITGKHSFHSGIDMEWSWPHRSMPPLPVRSFSQEGREAMEDASSYGIPTALKRFTHIWQLTIRRRAKSSGKGLLSALSGARAEAQAIICIMR